MKTQSLLAALTGTAVASALALSATAPASAAPASTVRTVQGEVREIHLDPRSGEPQKTDYRQVVVSGDQTYDVTGRNLPVDHRVQVQALSDGQLSGSIVDLGPAVSAPQIATTGNTRMLVMLAHWSSPDAVTPASARSTVFGQTNDYLKEVSYGKVAISGEVTPWMKIAGPAQGQCWADHRGIMTQAKQGAKAAGFDPSAYGGFILYFPNNDWQRGNDCTGKGGWAYVGGNEVWVNGDMKLRTVGHELGHNYGLVHSHSYMCIDGLAGSCQFDDYGDAIDMMGSTSPSGHFNAAQKARLGWFAGRSTNLTQGGSATLAPVSAQPLAISAVKVQASTQRTYWLEYRQPVGHDAVLPWFTTDGIQVRAVDPSFATGVTDSNNPGSSLIDPRPGDYASWKYATLRPGESWTTPEGFVFRAESAGATATVTVTAPPNVAPTVVASSPARAATGVSLATRVTATFSEPVLGVKANFTLVRASTGAKVTATAANVTGTNKWVLTPSANLRAGTKYTATLTGGRTAIRDTTGKPLTTFRWSFTTRA